MADYRLDKRGWSHRAPALDADKVHRVETYGNDSLRFLSGRKKARPKHFYEARNDPYNPMHQGRVGV